MKNQLAKMIRRTPKAKSMQPQPIVSVVIPSYYHEAYLEAAINSVLEQTRSDVELIVVDDGSKDRSRCILSNLRDRRVIVELQENAGAHNAINRGMARACAPYIAILNSDDVFSPDRLDIMVTQMQEENADLACSWIQQMDHVGKLGPIKKGWTSELPGWAENLPEHDVDEGSRFAYELLRSNFISTTSNIVVSRRIYEKIGGMKNLRFAHDWDFAFRAAAEGKCIMVPETLMRYRTHGTNTISSNRDWMLFEICWILARHFETAEKLLPGLPKDVLEQSHYGSFNPLYDVLRKDIAKLRSKRKRDTFANLLLDNEAARKPYIDMIAQQGTAGKS